MYKSQFWKIYPYDPYDTFIVILIYELKDL